MRRGELLSGLPAAWPESPLEEIRGGLGARGTIVVLDDDPTGTQTVYDVPVAARHDRETLEEALAGKPAVLFVLTNSRALTEAATIELHRELGRTLTELGVDQVISRSDSTLRGHYPVEIDALAEGLELKDGVTLLVPFFEAGGRITVGDRHYVLEGEEAVPAHETPFARDPVFSFSHSNLPRYVEEKTKGRVKAEDVAMIGLETIRKGGPEGVAAVLRGLNPGSVCAANAVEQRDVEVLAAAVARAERAGVKVLARSAASYVQARAGLAGRDPLGSDAFSGEEGRGGLVVVGSHVPKTTAQLASLRRAMPDWLQLELNVGELLKQGLPDDMELKLGEAIESGRHVLVFTSRGLIAGSSDEENLSISATVSRALVNLVARAPRPRFLIAKGGITSSDIATEALGVRIARVLGAILPGVPVWELGEETRFPGLPFVIFPGNVGGDDAVLEAVRKLT